MRALAIAAASAWLLWCLALVVVVPPHSDEFIHYRPIHCWTAPHANLLPDDYCVAQELRLPGASGFAPIRAYDYIGVSAAIAYWPVYRVWREPVSARVAGVATLLIIAFLLARFADVPLWAAALLALANLPLVFQTLFDTGPVAFQLAAILFVAWLGPRMRTTWQGGAVGLAIFVALEHKPFFAVALPGLAIVTLARLPGHLPSGRAGWTRLARAWGAAALAAAVPTGLLLFARDHRGATYLEGILAHARGPLGAARIPERLADFRTYGVDLGNFSHRIFFSNAEWSLATAAYWLLAALLVSLALWLVLRERDAGSARAFVLAASSAGAGAFVTLVLIARTRESWAGHHVILVAPFVLALLALAARQVLARRPREAGVLLALMAACQIALGVEVMRRTPHAGGKSERPMPQSHESWNQTALLAALRDGDYARAHFLAVTAWGILDFATLYGDPALAIVNVPRLPAVEIRRRIASAERETGLAPLFAVRNAPPPRLLRAYSHLRRVYPSSDSEPWQLWSP